MEVDIHTDDTVKNEKFVDGKCLRKPMWMVFYIWWNTTNFILCTGDVTEHETCQGYLSRFARRCDGNVDVFSCRSTVVLWLVRKKKYQLERKKNDAFVFSKEK